MKDFNKMTVERVIDLTKPNDGGANKGGGK
jgi:hypothetical protein